MDPRLKERLIGAAVLVALAVWLIPWVLDGPEPVRETPPLTLELPLAPETPAMRRQTIDLAERREDSAQPAAIVPPARDSEAVAVPDPGPTAVAAADNAPAALAEPDKAPPPAGSDSAPAPSSAAAPQRTPPTAAQRPARGDWMVQLGSFGERENADRLASRVATFGSAPEVSTTRAGGRVMYRVRVGPHDSRELAEAAASSLSAHGFVAQVVTVD